jgi:hypothetical protein
MVPAMEVVMNADKRAAFFSRLQRQVFRLLALGRDKAATRLVKKVLYRARRAPHGPVPG